MRAACWIVGLLLAAPGIAWAQDSAELAGLLLADETKSKPVQDGGSSFSIEPMLRRASLRPGGDVQDSLRLALEFNIDHPLSPDWRLLAADRLELANPASSNDGRNAVNTLKELYVSRRPRGSEFLLDAGRINARYGVAFSYNPTDFFREGAVRVDSTFDPASLRENRLGTVMLRGQKVWDDGSLTAIYAPRLASQSTTSGWSPDWGATNRRDRWMLAWSQRWGEDFAPQWLLYGNGESNDSPQIGVNLTRLLNPSCLALLEVSAGHGASLYSRATGDTSNTGWLSRGVVGVNCTAAQKLTLGVELQRNGAALDDKGWRDLRAGPIPTYGAYRQQAQLLRDPSTRRNLFLTARWQDALWPRLDLSAFMQVSLSDQSRVYWAEARYHFKDMDIAAQWQTTTGEPRTEYGAQRQKHVFQLLLKKFF
ncbi:hypothetical protein QTI66_30530 [Variovorax sp. J22R133]|uniref:hypothetical protein n=1 Tax=Variovorax brevis TaxID=3053503 RepID=UPI002575C42F|nr:hypothetical protein [Variovorax sp. J22R133]MDM0116485.1 hypothetical protein [Variovorax sp. J22R133]